MVQVQEVDLGVLKRGNDGIAYIVEWSCEDVWGTLPSELKQLFGEIEDLIIGELCGRCEPDCGPHCPVFNMLRFLRAAKTSISKQLEE